MKLWNGNGMLQSYWRSLALSCAACASLAVPNVQAEVIPIYEINETSGTYLQAILTHDIYRYSSNSSLSDLVVIDKQGNKLPYRIMSTPVEVTKKSTTRPVRFFAVEEGTSAEKMLALSKASIQVNDRSITLAIDNSHQSSVPGGFYLVDISNISTFVNRLLVDWQGDDVNQYLEVEVSGTKDLQHWQSLSVSTLAKLQKEDQTLLRNWIPLSIQLDQYSYLKLKFLRGHKNVQLTNIQIQTDETLTNPIPEDKWEVAGIIAKDQDSALNAASYSSAMPVAAWEFERNDRAPVNTISLNLGTSHYGDSIRIFSKRTKKQPWQLQHQGIWFNAQVGNAWQQSDPFSIYSNADPYWRVELNEAVRKTHHPKLVFQRAPQVLQFIANHSSPYSVAIDNQAPKDNQQTSTQIFLQLINLKAVEWQTVNPVKLESTKDFNGQNTPSVDWKTLVFWSALLIAVGVLIGFAVRLLKQMK